MSASTVKHHGAPSKAGTIKIVILGANELQNRLILKAKSLGYETHVFAIATNDIGERTADYFYPISTADKDAIFAECSRIHPDAICSIASDFAVPTINYLTEKLGLPGNPTTISKQCTNKFKQREVLAAHHIKTPQYLKTSHPNYDFATLLANFKFPVIVKPTDRSGSRGITKVENLQNIPSAVASAITNSFENAAIIEEFIEGNEYSCESVSQDGQHHILTTTKKYTTGAPHFIETGHTEPSDISTDLQASVEQTVIDALNALSIQNGASHTEFKIDKDNSINIIEIGARMGGDCIGSDLVELSTGYDYLKMVLDVAMGNQIDIQPTSQPHNLAAVKFIFSSSDLAKVKRISTSRPDLLCYLSHITAFDHAVTDSSNRMGFAIFAASTPEDAQKLKKMLYN